MLPFLLPAHVFRPTSLRSAASTRRLVPSTSTSCSRRFTTAVETDVEESEAPEGVAGEFDESDPWSQFHEGDFESVGGGHRKGGRSGHGASVGSAAAWLAGEGLQFKRPTEGKPNWLGVKTPFPLNPTFRPPAPIGEHIKQDIWEKFVGQPKTYTPKTLSLEYRLSVPRIEAIIRLKALEYLWRKEGKDLRTDFRDGMESYLGVMKPDSLYSKDGAAINDRTESNTADQLDYETDPATKTYVRTYFEMVEEGQIPVLPTKVQKDRQDTLRAVEKRATKYAKHAASDIQIFIPITPNRPRFVFEDVHMRYANTIDDKNRRGAEMERRRKIKEEKKVEKTIQVMKRREERAREAQKLARRRMAEERTRAAQAVKGLKVKLNASKPLPVGPAV